MGKLIKKSLSIRAYSIERLHEEFNDDCTKESKEALEQLRNEFQEFDKKTTR